MPDQRRLRRQLRGQVLDVPGRATVRAARELRRQRRAARHRDVDRLRGRLRDLDAGDVVALRGAVAGRAERRAAVGRLEDGVADAGVSRRRGDRQHAVHVGRIGERVEVGAVRARGARRRPAAAVVAGEREPLGRDDVHPVRGRRAHLVKRAVVGLGPLAAPDPRLSVVVRRDDAEVRREPDRVRLRLRRHDALRIRERAIRARGAGMEQRRDGQRKGAHPSRSRPPVFILPRPAKRQRGQRGQRE